MKKILTLFLVLVGFSFVNTASAQARYLAGTDYKVLDNQLPAFKSGEKEVVEFFWFGCPHCYQLEGSLHQWLNDSKPADVGFYSVPATSGGWVFAAQAKYTADKLGLGDDFRTKYFREYNANHNRAAVYDRKAFDKFVVDNFNVEKEAVDKAWNSFEVKNKVKRATELQKLAGVTGVPALIVNGKYLVSPGMAKTEKGLFEIVNFLLATTEAPK